MTTVAYEQIRFKKLFIKKPDPFLNTAKIKGELKGELKGE